ncbi:hypothetical protein KY285_024061 [Solanum tuberosum]|nr:hypothetical protein KY289_024415 [Solanum tuberosum]KAH0676260.1 hypothetical protein KY285_024061 [Solanum tuberosum]
MMVALALDSSVPERARRAHAAHDVVEECYLVDPASSHMSTRALPVAAMIHDNSTDLTAIVLTHSLLELTTYRHGKDSGIGLGIEQQKNSRCLGVGKAPWMYKAYVWAESSTRQGGVLAWQGKVVDLTLARQKLK